jgi:hypothetical protein
MLGIGIAFVSLSACASDRDAFATDFLRSCGIDMNDYSLFRFDYAALARESAERTGRGAIFLEANPRLPAWTTSARIEGSMRDVGFHIGSIAAASGFGPARIDEASRALNDRILAMYREFFPPWLEKAEGIGEAFGIALEDLDLRVLEREFFVRLGWMGLDYETRKRISFRMLGTGCSVAVARVVDEDGSRSVVAGRNFDWLQPNGTYFDSSITGLLRSKGMTIICPDHWVMDGINEKGLFVAVLTVGSSPEASWGGLPYPDEPAVDTHHLMRIVLDTCATVADAEAMAASVRVWHGSENVHFVVADASGDIALFEFGADGKLVVDRMRERDFMVVTNDWMSGKSELERLRCWRYAVGRETLRASYPIRRGALRDATYAMVNHPDNPLSHYGAGPYYFDVLRTVWTSIYDLGAMAASVDFHDGASDAFLFSIAH